MSCLHLKNGEALILVTDSWLWCQGLGPLHQHPSDDLWSVWGRDWTWAGQQPRVAPTLFFAPIFCWDICVLLTNLVGPAIKVHRGAVLKIPRITKSWVQDQGLRKYGLGGKSKNGMKLVLTINQSFTRHLLPKQNYSVVRTSKVPLLQNLYGQGVTWCHAVADNEFFVLLTGLESSVFRTCALPHLFIANLGKCFHLFTDYHSASRRFFSSSPSV